RVILLLAALAACAAWPAPAAAQAAPPATPAAPAPPTPPAAHAAPAAPSAPTAPPPAADEQVAVTILHINDVHGHTEPRTEGGRSVGGYARLATLVAEARAASKAARVFLVHAGDEFSRGDQMTRQSLGKANVAIWNHLALDIWTPGNGDYYDGLENLRARIAQFKGTVLASNVRVAESGAPLTRPYVIHRAGPVRVAFFGLCWLQQDDPASVQFRVDDAAATAARLAADLRKQADVVVAVSHQGRLADNRLAARVAGLDLIIGGHTHHALPRGDRVKGPGGREVLIVQAGEYLDYLGRVDLVLAKDGQGWRIAEAKASLLPLDGKVKLDPTVTALIARLFEESNRSLSAEPAAAAP
ncbi:MAG: hypothetical protein FJ288_16925, partial [Planctomycetes bacterium]|nr:hypothetical protein [Planctomycetota bacterium]